MKKHILIVCCILVTSLAFGQSFQNRAKIKSSFSQANLIQIPTLDFSVAFTKKSGNSFSVYNPITGGNDSFNKYQDFYSYSNSTVLFSNQFRGIKVDSFNPYGVDNPGAAIVTGLLQLLF